MLQNTENTLTNSQISEFILDREYTNYFHLQQAISELVEAELITMDTRSNVSHYRISVTPRSSSSASSTRRGQRTCSAPSPSPVPPVTAVSSGRT